MNIPSAICNLRVNESKNSNGHSILVNRKHYSRKLFLQRILGGRNVKSGMGQFIFL